MGEVGVESARDDGDSGSERRERPARATEATVATVDDKGARRSFRMFDAFLLQPCSAAPIFGSDAAWRPVSVAFRFERATPGTRRPARSESGVVGDIAACAVVMDGAVVDIVAPRGRARRREGRGAGFGWVLAVGGGWW